jgi:hypothetical protein
VRTRNQEEARNKADLFENLMGDEMADIFARMQQDEEYKTLLAGGKKEGEKMKGKKGGKKEKQEDEHTKEFSAEEGSHPKWQE